MSSWVVTDAHYIGYEARWVTKSGKPLKSNFMAFLLSRRTIAGKPIVKPFTLSMGIHTTSEFHQLLVAAGVIERSTSLSNVLYRDFAEQIGADLRERCPTVLLEFGQRKGGRSLGIISCRAVSKQDTPEPWMMVWPEDKVIGFKKAADA